jgi:hypothetical protein
MKQFKREDLTAADEAQAWGSCRGAAVQPLQRRTGGVMSALGILAYLAAMVGYCIILVAAGWKPTQVGRTPVWPGSRQRRERSSHGQFRSR